MGSSKTIKLGFVGFGTVGQSAFVALQRNLTQIKAHMGFQLEIVSVAVKDLEKKRAAKLSGVRLTNDPFDVVLDPNVDIVVELIGGTEIARELVSAAIANGKHVVTANKALIAIFGDEILLSAQNNKTMVRFEAAVAGSIPIVKALSESVRGDNIKAVVGIINGTCNFMLSEMANKQVGFASILKEAQRRGYAEADPSFDVMGTDAGHKLAILSAIAFDTEFQFDKIHIEGIQNVLAEDIAYANGLGYQVKHLALAVKTRKGLELRVHPALIPSHHILASVDGVVNAILVEGDLSGPLMFSGAGAGGDATASAVISDIIDVASALHINGTEAMALRSEKLSDYPISAITESVSGYYVRVEAKDRPGVLAEISRVLASFNVSIEAIHQKEAKEVASTTVPIIILTGRMAESAIREVCEILASSDGIFGSVVCYKVEDFQWLA
jgi:homoserine dehydrogenase